MRNAAYNSGILKVQGGPMLKRWKLIMLANVAVLKRNRTVMPLVKQQATTEVLVKGTRKERNSERSPSGHASFNLLVPIA